ncbi:MAG: hypothetical protein M3N46_08320 [Actinomycetota bacterium]|nr:hypothetical protein [Actinomycetota bacterium]
MSDAMTQSAPTSEPTGPKLQLIGAADAEACVGEFCELPAHREQAVMNRRVDLDAV